MIGDSLFLCFLFYFVFLRLKKPKGKGYLWPRLSQVCSRLFPVFSHNSKASCHVLSKWVEGPQRDALEAGRACPGGQGLSCEEGGDLSAIQVETHDVDGPCCSPPAIPRAPCDIANLRTLRNISLLCINFIFDFSFGHGGVVTIGNRFFLGDVFAPFMSLSQYVHAFTLFLWVQWVNHFCHLCLIKKQIESKTRCLRAAGFVSVSVTDCAVEPLKAELAELEQLIRDQQDKICAVKAAILRNEEKIQRMVRSVTLSSRRWALASLRLKSSSAWKQEDGASLLLTLQFAKNGQFTMLSN